MQRAGNKKRKRRVISVKEKTSDPSREDAQRKRKGGAARSGAERGQKERLNRSEQSHNSARKTRGLLPMIEGCQRAGGPRPSPDPSGKNSPQKRGEG